MTAGIYSRVDNNTFYWILFVSTFRNVYSSVEHWNCIHIFLLFAVMTEVNLPIYEGESDEENEPPAKKQRASNIWQKSDVFEDKETAMDFIKAENSWALRKSNVSVDAGLKTFFYCNQINYKRSANECPAKIYLLESFDDGQFSVYRNNKEHIHDGMHLAGKQTGRHDLLELVKNCLDRDCPPRAISNEIRQNENMQDKPTDGQVLQFH